MKKLLILTITTMMLFSGCATTYDQVTNETNINNEILDDENCYGYFTVIVSWGSGMHIVYANDTKVKYLIIEGVEKYAITPLYNADGTLQIYEGE